MTINGSAFDDVIQISYINAALGHEVEINGSFACYVPPETTSVEIYADGEALYHSDNTAGGNDFIDIQLSAAHLSLSVFAAGGNDIVFGGPGHDYIHGGHGDDQMTGASGNDTVATGYGLDDISGGSGNDQLYSGFSGYDVGYEERSGNTSYDYGTADRAKLLTGREGNDTISGGYAVDVIAGGGGHDHLIGKGMRDVIFGGPGNDLIYGDTQNWGSSSDGRDDMIGGSGNDTLRGGKGADIFIGDEGDDLFEAAASFGTIGVTDYDPDSYFSGGDGTDTAVLGNGDHDRPIASVEIVS